MPSASGHTRLLSGGRDVPTFSIAPTFVSTAAGAVCFSMEHRARHQIRCKASQKYARFERPALSARGGLLSCARLRQAFITPTSVNHVLARHSAPSPLDLLTVDMDGQDFWVLSAFDFQRYRPRVIAVEFFSHFASNQLCTTRRHAAYIWDFKTDAEVGTSLALWN